VVTIPVATSVATVSTIGDLSDFGKVPSLGQIWSGWRDLNSRPLDPQSSALPSCATARWPCSTSISHERELYYEDASGQQRSLLRHNRPRGPLGMPELRAGIRVC
jgi:hypothetical protein